MMAEGNPEQGPYREQWLFLVGRLRGMGETVPVITPAQTAQAPRADYSRPVVQARPAPAGDPEPVAAPTADPPPPAKSVNQAELAQARSRLIQVTAKAKSAEEMYYDLRQNAQRLGYSLNPDTTEAYNGMQGAMEEARRDLDLGQLDAAREQLDIVEAFAKRVLKAGGR